MNVFDSLTSYGQKWELVESRNFTPQEKAVIASNKVVQSEYGLSVCFTMVGGASKYIPLSIDSPLQFGDSLNMDSAKLLKLERDGKTTYRVK